MPGDRADASPAARPSTGTRDVAQRSGDVHRGRADRQPGGPTVTAWRAWWSPCSASGTRLGCAGAAAGSAPA